MELNEDRNLKNAFIFKNIIDNFPPDSELFYFLGHGSVLLGKELDEKKTPQEFTITADYQFHSNTYSEKITINLKQYRGIVIYSESSAEYLKDVAKQLEEIKNKLNKLN